MLYSFSLPLLKKKKNLESPIFMSSYFWPSLIVCWVYRLCIEGNAYFHGWGGHILVGAILVHAIWFNSVFLGD